MPNAKSVLTGALLAVALATAAAAPPPPATWKDGYVLTNGIRMHYWRTGGAKPPLVLAHGSSDDGLCWTALAKELEGAFDIMPVDTVSPTRLNPTIPPTFRPTTSPDSSASSNSLSQS